MKFGRIVMAWSLGALSGLSAHAAGTWTAQASGTTQTLRSVQRGPGGLCAAAGDSGRVLVLPGSGPWLPHALIYMQGSAVFRLQLNAVTVIDSQRIAVAGNGITYFTGNRGGVWLEKRLEPNAIGIHTVQGRLFLIAELPSCGGQICNHLSLLYTAENPDSLDWRRVGETVWNNPNGIKPAASHFTSPTRGHVAFANMLRGTLDGGANWSTHAVSGTPRALDFAGVRIGWVAGDGGMISKTTDSGATWLLRGSGTARRLNGIRFADDLRGYAVGDSGTILSTIDGGESWTPMAAGTTANLLAVTLAGDGTTGYAVGTGGTLLKLTGGTPSGLASPQPRVSGGARARLRPGMSLALPDGRVFSLLGKRAR